MFHNAISFVILMFGGNYNKVLLVSRKFYFYSVSSSDYFAQGQVNTIEFDYKEYAKQRFQEYWARKPYLLSSDAPSPFNNPEGTGI